MQETKHARQEKTRNKKSRVIDAQGVKRALVRMAHEIVERDGDDALLLAGLGARGAILAERLRSAVVATGHEHCESGMLDVTLYRDDVGSHPLRSVGATSIGPTTNKVVVVVDDVLYTGRTARAALDAIVGMGRPKAIRLAVLCDRGHRELPIRADYVGKNLPTAADEHVVVSLEPDDPEDFVEIHG